MAPEPSTCVLGFKTTFESRNMRFVHSNREYGQCLALRFLLQPRMKQPLIDTLKTTPQMQSCFSFRICRVANLRCFLIQITEGSRHPSKSSHNTMAKPTAPPNTPTTSHPQVLDLGARPVCKPAAGPVVLGPAPAEPLGVMTAGALAWITVTAVIVD